MRSDKGHRNRKNPASAEFYKKQRKERNAARPKQDLEIIITAKETVYRRTRD